MPKGATFLVDRDEFGQERIKYAPKPYKTFYRQGDLNEYAMATNKDTPEMLIESKDEYSENFLNVRPNTTLRDMLQEQDPTEMMNPEDVFLKQTIGEKTRYQPVFKGRGTKEAHNTFPRPEMKPASAPAPAPPENVSDDEMEVDDDVQTRRGKKRSRAEQFEESNKRANKQRIKEKKKVRFDLRQPAQKRKRTNNPLPRKKARTGETPDEILRRVDAMAQSANDGLRDADKRDKRRNEFERKEKDRRRQEKQVRSTRKVNRIPIDY